MSADESTTPHILVLGIGNVLMGDEGVGVHVVRELERGTLPAGAVCLDGGTGGFTLLEPLEAAERVVLVDATVDGAAPGTLHRLRPRFASDYPPTLTAHDIGLKDLLDAFHLLGERPDVTLFAISIAPPAGLDTDLTPELAARVPDIAARVRDEVWRLLGVEAA